MLNTKPHKDSKWKHQLKIAHWADKFSTAALGEMLFIICIKYCHIVDTTRSIT